MSGGEASRAQHIPEPKHCGATVLAAQKGEVDGSARMWVRFRHGLHGCWIDQYEHVRNWDDLDNPQIQTCEGVES